ncbi:hypothetical protein IMCC14465_17090 [alpha proteobacterium IMCC14465]|uniref:Uncharacterized protein n=1 Tax=alpha proteobacterium IMCC14465 TaxID=1220535 RepID=J9DY60_9PROT|nr:hypothetical protein IMCC14465_17090 [alpha proteobacterium IMCC14465]
MASQALKICAGIRHNLYDENTKPCIENELWKFHFFVIKNSFYGHHLR